MIETLPQFESKWIDFSQNCELICYTDGLVEIENQQHEAFGEESILTMLNSKETGNTSDNLINAVECFRDGMPYIDEIAILSVQM
jgi:serine phosphatase RsbU (regulator of sigma subunit)